jgi:enediyne biosynthesis protein E4
VTEGVGLYCPASPSGPGGGGPGEGTHFLDLAEEAGIAGPSMPFTTFGAVFADIDLDGYPDIVTANGHVNEQVARLGGAVTFDERMQLFHNEPGDRPGTRRFREVGESVGDGITKRRVGRGLAAGDFDGDGDPDLLVTANNGRAALLRNEGGTRNHWLAIRPRGVKSNRDGLGTKVVLQAGGRKQIAWVRSGSSYCSDSEHVARFGLGSATQADVVELHWPSGAIQTLRDVRADQILQVIEAAD